MNSNIKNILIVEDDYQLALEWKKELETKAYHAEIVTNANDAKLLLHNDYDCFIVDLFHVRNNEFLPDGGIRCIAQIRKYDRSHKNKSPLIITVTGYYRDGEDCKISTADVTATLGANYTLKKPIDFPKILQLIEDWDT